MLLGVLTLMLLVLRCSHIVSSHHGGIHPRARVHPGGTHHPRISRRVHGHRQDI